MDNDDVLIDVADAELRKQLNLTTADLRFMEHIIQTVSINTGDDAFLDDTGLRLENR